MGDVSTELRQKIIEYLASVDKSKNREVAKQLGENKKLVDKAIGELAKEGKIEYLYLNGSFIKLIDK